MNNKQYTINKNKLLPQVADISMIYFHYKKKKKLCDIHIYILLTTMQAWLFVRQTQTEHTFPYLH